MEFHGQECWMHCHCFLKDLPDQGPQIMQTYVLKANYLLYEAQGAQPSAVTA